jgi:nucleotide-binding universal stress UspA family protein
MKAILGVDHQGSCLGALDLFARLDFRQPELTLLHAADPLVGYPAFAVAPYAHYMPDYVVEAKEAGMHLLDATADVACSYSLPASQCLVVGSAAAALLDHADAIDADLIAVATEAKRAFGSLYLGSVSRSLVLGAKQSLLIAKGEVRHQGPLTAIFATDHSDYADRCLDRLIQMRPKGIGHLFVVTAR